jgi:hypothetical protein
MRGVQVTTSECFEKMLTHKERRIMAGLKSPVQIQRFLDGVPYSKDSFYRCPLRVQRDRVAHCFDGALFAAAALRRIGYPPLIVDLLPNDRDDEHLLAVFKQDRRWGAVAKSNFVGLRFREPVYRTLGELAMSYFEPYFNVDRERTLRGYTRPLSLKPFDRLNWMTSDEHLERIAQRIDRISRFSLLTDEMVVQLSLVDDRSYRAGLLGADDAGLFKPR